MPVISFKPGWWFWTASAPASSNTCRMGPNWSKLGREATSVHRLERPMTPDKVRFPMLAANAIDDELAGTVREGFSIPAIGAPAERTIVDRGNGVRHPGEE